MTQASKFSVQQVAVSALPGFTYSQNFTVVTPYTVGAGDFFGTEQRIEGYNIADLAWGTVNAKSVTLSFWVYANNTGTYCGSLYTTTGGSYVYNYTVSAANTWQYVTVTIPGSTAYALGSTTNSAGIYLRWTLTAGSNFQTTANSWVAGNYAVTSGAFNWIGTSGATFYITGVQLEVGTKATPYEMQIYSDQLAQCQRYYWKTYNQGTVPGAASSTATYRTRAYVGSYAAAVVQFPVLMRTTPTVTLYNPFTGSTNSWRNSDDSTNATASLSTVQDSAVVTESSSVTTNNSYFFQIVASAEL